MLSDLLTCLPRPAPGGTAAYGSAPIQDALGMLDMLAPRDWLEPPLAVQMVALSALGRQIARHRQEVLVQQDLVHVPPPGWEYDLDVLKVVWREPGMELPETALQRREIGISLFGGGRRTDEGGSGRGAGCGRDAGASAAVAAGEAAVSG